MPVPHFLPKFFIFLIIFLFLKQKLFLQISKSVKDRICFNFKFFFNHTFIHSFNFCFVFGAKVFRQLGGVMLLVLDFFKQQLLIVF